MSLAVIGLFVLWLGWFGFNPGSTMSFQNPADVVSILMTTNTAAIAAVLTSTITSWLYLGKPDLGMTINGCLAGLVGITGSCAYVSVLSSLIIGALAGVLVVFLVVFFDKIYRPFRIFRYGGQESARRTERPTRPGNAPRRLPRNP